MSHSHSDGDGRCKACRGSHPGRACPAHLVSDANPSEPCSHGGADYMSNPDTLAQLGIQAKEAAWCGACKSHAIVS